MCRRPARRILGPSLGQIQRPVDKGVPLARDIGREYADLAVGDLARRTRVLPRHAAGGLALLQKAGLVNDQNGVIRRQVFERILAHHVAQRIGLPAAPPQDRLLPPGAGVTGSLGAHPARLASLLPKQPIEKHTRRCRYPFLREQGAHPPLHLPQRCRPQLQCFLNRRAAHPSAPDHPGEDQNPSSKMQL
jgi:hypothetical protein